MVAILLAAMVEIALCEKIQIEMAKNIETADIFSVVSPVIVALSEGPPLYLLEYYRCRTEIAEAGSMAANVPVVAVLL